MDNWTLTHLGCICSKVCSGGTPSSRNAEYYDGGIIPWLNTKEIDFNRIWATEKNITEAGLSNSSAKWIEADTVIVAMYGATAGKTAIAKIPLTTNQACCNLAIDNSKADYRFVYYWLKDNYVRIALLANGGAQQNLNAQIIKELEIALPPLSIQKAIADILSVLDDKIENNTKINNCLEQMAQAIFKSWFVDFEPWGGERPASWNICAISDISSDIVCGKTPSTKISEYFGDDIPFITIPDMHGVVYITSTERSLSAMGAESQSSKTVPSNSVCISCIATAGLVVLTSAPSQTNQQINTIVCKDGISPYFVYLSMVGKTDCIKMLGSSGSATNNLNKSQFSKIELVIPEGNDMREFSTLVEPLFEAIKANQQENTFLAKTRDSLLPRLISGNLRI